MRANRTIGIMIAGGAFGVILGIGTPAKAWYVKHAAAFCSLACGSGEDDRDHATVTGYILNSASDYEANMVCPVTDTTNTPMGNADWVHVHVYDGSSTGYVSVRACVQYWDSTGGACDASATHTTGPQTGTLMLTINDPIWNSYTDDFGYVAVNLPSGGTSKLLGYSFGTS